MRASFVSIQDERAKVTTKESESIAILNDVLFAVKTSTTEVVCIKKYCRAHEMAL